MSWFKKLFPPNDWETVKVFQGKWLTHVIDDFGDYDITNTSVYKVQYSRYRNTFRIEMNGYKPEKHPMYETVVEYKMECYKMNQTIETPNS